MPINLGCTWNDSLVEQVFSEAAWQASAVGINVGLSPVVDMFPDARFGRMQEGFSEAQDAKQALASRAQPAHSGRWHAPWLVSQ